MTDRRFLKLIEEDCPVPSDAKDAADGANRQIAHMTDVAQTRAEEVGMRKSVQIPRTCGDDGTFNIYIYQPKGKGPFPAVLWLHGGGFVFRNKEHHTGGTYSRICNRANCVVVSPTYRLTADGDKFPKGQDDCFDAYKWMIEHAEELNIDVNRLFTCGESAGGNLSATLSVRIRDAGLPQSGQIILCAILIPYSISPDFYKKAMGPYNYWIGWEECEGCWEGYFNSPEDSLNPYVNVFRTTGKGLPPALIVIAGEDPCATDGQLYVQKLKRDGIDATCVTYSDMPHNFWQFDKVFPTESKQFFAQLAEFISPRSRL